MSYPENTNPLSVNKNGEPVAPKHHKAALEVNRKKTAKMGKTKISPGKSTKIAEFSSDNYISWGIEVTKDQIDNYDPSFGVITINWKNTLEQMAQECEKAAKKFREIDNKLKKNGINAVFIDVNMD